MPENKKEAAQAREGSLHRNACLPAGAAVLEWLWNLLEVSPSWGKYGGVGVYTHIHFLASLFLLIVDMTQLASSTFCCHCTLCFFTMMGSVPSNHEPT